MAPAKGFAEILPLGLGFDCAFEELFLRIPATKILGLERRDCTKLPFKGQGFGFGCVKHNAKRLAQKGVRVLHGMDATKLAQYFPRQVFQTILFQFPNVASREPIQGLNPNFVLVQRFLQSAKPHLVSGGRMIISVVDSPYYRGLFHFEEAAEQAGFPPPHVATFDPDDFPGYHHTMSHEEESAIDDYEHFASYIFTKTP